MIIFLIFVLILIILLSINIKLSIFFELNGTASDLKIKFLFWELKRKGKFVLKRKKDENKIDKKKNKKSNKKNFIDKKFITDFMKKIKFEKLYIYEEIGFLEPFYTAIATSVISTLTVIPIRLLNVNYDNFYYKVVPFYMDLKFKLKIETVISFKIINLLFFIIKKSCKLQKQPLTTH